MHCIVDVDAVGVKPTPSTPTTTARQYFQNGSPRGQKLATVADAFWFNTVQDELLNLLDVAGIIPDRFDDTQVAQSIKFICGLFGVMPWDDKTDYSLRRIVWGDDHEIYISTNPSGPGHKGIGPQNPLTTTGYWKRPGCDSGSSGGSGSSGSSVNILNQLVYPSAFHSFYEITPPPGWMVRNGALIPSADKTVPELWEYLRAPNNSRKLKTESQWQAMSDSDEWNGIGGVPFFVLDTTAKTIRLPDTRGMYQEDAGFDGLSVGDTHGDAIRKITARSSRIQYTHPPSLGSGAFTLGSTGGVGGYYSTVFGTGQGAFELILDTSMAVPTATVNRPKAFGMLGCVYVGLSAEQGGGK